MTQRAAITLSGLVQGVGFRPFVYTLANAIGVRGLVRNRGSQLFIDAEGEAAAIATLIRGLTQTPPPHSRIDAVEQHALPPLGYQAFSIAESAAADDDAVWLPPDLATCERCLGELFDPANRRYRHPFISCTACGPRYSIITSLPFDRARTTMAGFRMCERCAAEYDDPADRRFHAQTICCHGCGPVLRARDARSNLDRLDDPFGAAIGVINDGGIVAVKGLGGFHLACDATNTGAVARLRERKGRDARPFAVMCSMAAARRLLGRDAAPWSALSGAAAPVGLIDRERLAGWRPLANTVAPRCATVGLVLPYTPAHHLLLAGIDRPLVMTSGNRSDEPMACDNGDAIRRLGAIADLLLLHDRDIHARADDSVERVDTAQPMPIRLGRGRAPAPLTIPIDSPAPLLAVGGHLKNTCCFVSGARAYMSPHIGTLDGAASRASFAATVEHLERLLRIRPEIVAHDRHPDYASTQFALERTGAARIPVQHHHAHVLSCVAEHGLTDPVIGVAFDGAGLGDDDAIWGGEFLIADGATYHRAAHLAYVPLPGGDAAAREPWRMAVSHLTAAFGAGLGPAGDALRRRVGDSKVAFVAGMMAKAVQSPPTSSMGRLFDAVASILGLRDVAGFEGQAAMELEALAAPGALRYAFAIDTGAACWTISGAPVIEAVAHDAAAGVDAAEIAGAFHHAVASMIAGTAVAFSRRTGIRAVVLSGGVFQNARLTQLAAAALAGAGLEVFTHERVPCNDGGLSLGQALAAARTVAHASRAESRAACV